MPGITISQGTTRIRFPPLGLGLTSRAASARKLDSTHSDAVGFAYVNNIGRESMLNNEHGTFPTGSLIVREKLPSAAAPSPEVLVVMVKREKDFNPRANGSF